MKVSISHLRKIIAHDFQQFIKEHGAFGRGSDITLDMTARPHNSFLGDMPYSADEKDEEDEELEEACNLVSLIFGDDGI